MYVTLGNPLPIMINGTLISQLKIVQMRISESHYITEIQNLPQFCRVLNVTVDNFMWHLSKQLGTTEYGLNALNGPISPTGISKFIESNLYYNRATGLYHMMFSH